MQIDSVEENLIDKLNVMYGVEICFLEAQQHMVRQIRNTPLRRLLVLHISETHRQIKNLKLIFRLMNCQPKAIVPEGVITLIRESQRQMQQVAINPTELEAVIVVAHLKMKDFEILGYLDLAKEIKQIGQIPASYLIAENLQQEEYTLKQLEGYFYAMPRSGTRMRPV